MAKIQYRKIFLKQLTSNWAVRFPDWKKGGPKPVFHAEQDTTFTCSSALLSRGLIFHAVIFFTPKRKGCFTADIIVNDGEAEIDSSGNRFRFVQDIPFLRVGEYRISQFINGQDRWWHLHDEVEEARKLYELIAKSTGDEPFNPLTRSEFDWYASNYEAPFAEIIAAAEADFSDTFTKHVLPKLGL